MSSDAECRAYRCFASAGGENVYCSEVEAVVSAHPEVLQAAAFGMPNSIMGEMVHSAVVLHDILSLRYFVSTIFCLDDILSSFEPSVVGHGGDRRVGHTEASSKASP